MRVYGFAISQLDEEDDQIEYISFNLSWRNKFSVAKPHRIYYCDIDNDYDIISILDISKWNKYKGIWRENGMFIQYRDGKIIKQKLINETNS